jgi:hypothetical protein
MPALIVDKLVDSNEAVSARERLGDMPLLRASTLISPKGPVEECAK